jgi:hypothetical protein
MNSCSTLQKYISHIEDYLVILALGIWRNVMGKNPINSTNILSLIFGNHYGDIVFK